MTFGRRKLGASAVVLLALAAGVSGAPRAARAGGELRAQMDCRVEAGTGRLLCTVALAAPEGRALRWSDALVVAAPPNARPLRSRVASAAGRPEQILLGFVLGAGEGGRIEVVARAVTCPVAPRAGACTPERRGASYELSLAGPPG